MNDGITQTSRVAMTKMEEVSGRNSHKHNTGARQTIIKNLVREGNIGISNAQKQKMNISRAAGSFMRIQETLPHLPDLIQNVVLFSIVVTILK
jgi:hypothetical protein